MAKSKKTGPKRSRSLSAAISQPTMFVSGMIWLFTTLSLVYLAVAYWKFG